MTNLKNIELEGNQFSGSVPASLCKLKEEYNLVGIKADCLGVEPLIQCDCCDVCCDEQTGECIDTINEWTKEFRNGDNYIHIHTYK